MCSLTAVAAAYEVGSALYSGIKTYAEDEANNEQAQAAKKQARVSAFFDFAALNDQQAQIRQQFDTEAFARQKQAARERARITVAAGEAGVAGNSTLRQIVSSMQQASSDQGVLAKNAENALNQTQRRRQAVKAREQSRINAANAAYIPWWQEGLDIAGSAAKGYFGAKSSTAGFGE